MTEMKNRVVKAFKTKFDSPVQITVKAPGRVNIIGEHTDYNNGYVLPAAIDYAIYFAFAKSDRRTTRVYSVDYDAFYELDKNVAIKTEEKWINLVLGVIDQLSDRIGQFDVVFAGNIPQGAGLSSSAALCCGLAFGLSELYELRLEKWSIAKIAQQSEHEFGGVACGIMDQFASVFGITNHVLELDCLTLEHQPHEFDISGYRLLLVDSGVTHALETSEYNVRREECNSAIDKLRGTSSGVSTYQDVTIALLEEQQGALSEKEYCRAKHVVSENLRVKEMVSLLKDRNFENAGRCLLDRHKSLKEDFEVTCEETNFLVHELIQHEVVLGARQVGGGFGGCVLAIAKDLNLNTVVDQVKKKYRKKFHLPLRVIPVKISSGCQVIS